MPNDARQAANDGNSRIINRMSTDDICFDSTIRAASTARFFQPFAEFISCSCRPRSSEHEMQVQGASVMSEEMSNDEPTI
jgi:hypothetical protein